MDLATFKKSVTLADMPPSLSVYLQAMWQDAKGNWEEAHHLIQELPDKKAAWIHAYLHRKEGDISNAGYWYSKAGKASPDTSLDEEWEQLVNSFL